MKARNWKFAVIVISLAVLAAGCNFRPNPGLVKQAAEVTATATVETGPGQLGVQVLEETPTATPSAMASPTATARATWTTIPPAAVTPVPTRPSEPIAPGTYIVQSGDTLFSIARRAGTTVNAIKQANGLTSNLIFAYQPLVIPRSPGPGAVHIVQAGENLFRIARRYGTTVDAIAAANNLADPSKIRVGQELVIPGKGQAR